MEEVSLLRRLDLPFDADENDLREAVRDFQASRGLMVTGEIDSRTQLALDSIPTAGLVPAWWGTEDQDEAVRMRLGACDGDSIRRFQSARRLPLTGVVYEETARALGG